MSHPDVLGCTIYFEADRPIQEIARLLSERLHGSIRSDGRVVELSSAHAEMELRHNPDANPERARAFPDGFLYFAWLSETYFLPESDMADRTAFVAGVLEVLWSLSLPAVAACDFEDKLPHAGGYKSSCVPWLAPASTVTQLKSVV